MDNIGAWQQPAKFQDRGWLHVLLFMLTLASTTLVGAVQYEGFLHDFAAREAFQPRLLPVGVLTGLVGGAYLAWLLSREWRKGRA